MNAADKQIKDWHEAEMKMSKHTPGPWSFGHWGNDFWVGTQPNGLSGKVARVLWGMGEGVEEGRENARLISSAPDLLDVAEMVLALATIDTPVELIKAATAAISKATGEQVSGSAELPAE